MFYVAADVVRSAFIFYQLSLKFASLLTCSSALVLKLGSGDFQGFVKERHPSILSVDQTVDHPPSIHLVYLQIRLQTIHLSIHPSRSPVDQTVDKQSFIDPSIQSSSSSVDQTVDHPSIQLTCRLDCRPSTLNSSSSSVD